MEELQSTEVLDREILEDARRKAYKILKSADDQAKANAAGWENKTADALAELRRRYEKRLAQGRAEIQAHLPLDRRRLRAEQIEVFLNDAARAWYAAQSRDRVLGLLEAELRNMVQAVNTGREWTAGAARCFIQNMSAAEAKKILCAAFGLKGFPDGWEIQDAPAGAAPAKYPALVLDTQALRLRVSVDMLLDGLLHDKREELAAALLGAEALAGDEGGPNCPD